MNKDQYELSINEFRLKLNGNSCEECRSVCQAICCRYLWDIKLTREEFQSGKYDAQIICIMSKKVCETSDIICKYQLIRINKKYDKSCIYLDENNLCSIHNYRPKICSDWLCDYSFILQPNRRGIKNNIITTPEDRGLKDDDIYIPYPFERLITVIFLADKSKLYFVKELIQKCQRFYYEVDFNYPNWDEEKIRGLIDLFGQSYHLGNLKEIFHQQLDNVPGESEFYQMVSILIKHKIIINASTFIA